MDDNQEFNKILGNMNLDELNITYLSMNNQHDRMEKVSGDNLALIDNATGMTGKEPRDGRCRNSGVVLDSCTGPFSPPPHPPPPSHLCNYDWESEFICYQLEGVLSSHKHRLLL